MKVIRTSLLLVIAALMYLSCQRELFFDRVSSGKLKKDAVGNCSPVAANGIFSVNTILTDSDFVEVQVAVTTAGTYDIRSDTVNGYFFANTGAVVKGTNTIRLYAKGKPLTAGDNNFKVTYGTSTCIFVVKVTNIPLAVFTLGGAPGFCTGVFENGSYIKDIALTGANTITVQVNVTTPGIYSLTASTNNGFQFSGNGIFNFPGIQTVTLTGTGTPLRDEFSNVVVTNIVSTCNFDIKVLAGVDGKAIFSFDGTPGDCVNYIVNGTYYAGIAASVNNFVTMYVTVTKTGTYDINTNAANGISFSNAGSFSNTGQQTVNLAEKGSPIRPELTAFIPNTGTQSCNFLVNVKPLPPPAVIVLSGAPNACTPVRVNGFYIVSKPLDAANTVDIDVNIITAGSYTIVTNNLNGISFSTSGVFTTTGLQQVTLQGIGIPMATGTGNFTPRYNASACSFTVTFQ